MDRRFDFRKNEIYLEEFNVTKVNESFNFQPIHSSDKRIKTDHHSKYVIVLQPEPDFPQ